MYEPVSHALLSDILDAVAPELTQHDLRHFHTRLGANFYAIHSLFHQLYGERSDFADRLRDLVAVLARQHISRDASLKALDVQRERDHNWFLHPRWVGMALYSDGFAGNLQGLQDKLPYFQELGVNLLHIMPILECPQGASDGGYAVSNFRAIDSRVGTLQDLRSLADSMRQRDMLLTLDVVVNHTSNEHYWAQQARAGDEQYQAYYYTYPDRTVPDQFEQAMPEIFPETAPGNFSYDPEMERWVMTVFNHYQWDLNYRNPAVFIEMLDIILFWANQGADILRLDAVAFLWKKVGTQCQNEREAHLLLQLMKDCSQVVAPGVLFIAEAIVAPVEIIKYFGEDAVIAKECEIAYNATLMALLWEAIATRNAKLLNQGIKSLPDKLDRATWLNYVRCHDDIGLGFDDQDISQCGYEPRAHRRFLLDYFTGAFNDSPSRGKLFGSNAKTGDARISGSLASLAGLEDALEGNVEEAVEDSIQKILLLHSITLAFGGIPLLYYGDELGTLNDTTFLEDTSKANDNRWMHRPRIDWHKASLRHQRGSIEYRVFHGLQRLIAVRQGTPAFADLNNRSLIETGNPHLFAFLRTNPGFSGASVLVVANFDARPQSFDLDCLGNRGHFGFAALRDLCSGGAPDQVEQQVTLPGYGFYWLV